MTSTIILTGVSRGLGLALFQQLYQREHTTLVTLSRNPPPGDQQPAAHIETDFTNPALLEAALNRLEEYLAGKKRLVFISNAGDVRPIKRTGGFLQEEIMNSLHINYTAPVMITNRLLSFSNLASLVNISSGAATHAVDGWAMYCSTKAATKAFFDVVAKENPGIQVVQVNPGIIDTAMQQEIRNADAADFSRLNEFIQYKNDQTLQTPAAAAEKIITQLTAQGII